MNDEAGVLEGVLYKLHRLRNTERGYYNLHCLSAMSKVVMSFGCCMNGCIKRVYPAVSAIIRAVLRWYCVTCCVCKALLRTCEVSSIFVYVML